MTVLTVTLPDAATDEIVEHIRRVGGTATPDMPTASERYLPLPPMVTLSPEERAKAWEILQQGGDPGSIVKMIRWYEEERDDRPLPGRA